MSEPDLFLRDPKPLRREIEALTERSKAATLRGDWVACAAEGAEWARLVRDEIRNRLGSGAAATDALLRADRSSLARALATRAEALFRLDRDVEAMQAWEESAEVSRCLLAICPSDDDEIGRLAETLEELAYAASRAGDTPSCLRRHEECVQAWKDLRAIHPADADGLNRLESALSTAAAAFEDAGDLDRALELRREQVATARAVAAATKDDLDRWNVHYTLMQLGDTHYARGELADAAAAYRESADISRAMLIERPDDPERLNPLAFSLQELRDTLIESGLGGEALPVAREVVEITRRMVAEDPVEPGDEPWERTLVTDLDDLGDLLAEHAEHEEAGAAHAEARDLARRLVALDPESIRFREDLALAAWKLGRALLEGGRAGDATDPLDEAVRECRELARRQPERARWRRRLGEALADLGKARATLGDPAAAADALDEGVELLRGTLGSDEGVSVDRLREVLDHAADAASAAGRGERASALRCLAVEAPPSAEDRSDSGDGTAVRAARGAAEPDAGS